MPAAHLPHVSVLIPTRDRPESLARCLESVCACDYPRFDVIVIDQGKREATVPSDPRVSVLRPSDGLAGKSRALNQAMAIAGGSIFAFTDDDCTVPSEWLTSGVDMLRAEPSVGLVFGALTAMPHDPNEVFVPTFLPETRQVLKGLSAIHIRGGAGANMFVRREVMHAIRGFDQLLGPGMIFRACEEYDVFYRTLRAGFAVARDPETRVVHWGARPIADGSGPQLLRDYFFGEGVVLAKHSHAGDEEASRLARQIFLQEVDWACRGALRGRLSGIRRATAWARGFVKGYTRAIDPDTRLFRERSVPSAPPTEIGRTDRRRQQAGLQHN